LSEGGAVDVDLWLRALGKRVRIMRLTRELTQDELAAAAGMSRSFVSLIEKGTHGVDVVRLLRLAAALDVPLAELIGAATPPDRRLPG
jgi:transcriptional regulator with XRE-family HTH domain